MEENSTIRKILQNGFWISLLLHLLLFLAVISLITKPETQKNKPLPHYYVPAYTYTGSIKPSAAAQQSTAAKQQTSSAKQITAESVEQPESIETVKQTESTLQFPKDTKKIPVKKTAPAPIQKSLLSSSFDMLKSEQMQEVSKKTESEPIYMIGDDSQPADPLIKLLGRSLSAHFSYPRTAGQLGIRGRVLIGLTLHPAGHYSDVQLLQSSENPDLDAAALYAVNSAPQISGADRFISKPKHFVVGFVFN